MQYIDKVGLEAEGAYFSDKMPSDLHGDSSVKFRRRDFKVRGQPDKFRRIEVGEVSSQPLSSLSDCKNWIYQKWPDKRNATCGFHIHISLKSKLSYSLLMKQEFYDEFLDWSYKFAKNNRMSKEFFNRLEGKNKFCKREFKPDEQVNHIHTYRYDDSSPRYSQLNYCLAHRGTMENRLPSAIMPKGKAIKLVKEYIEFVEDFLRRAHEKIDEHFHSFEIQNGKDSEIEEILLTNI